MRHTVITLAAAAGFLVGCSQPDTVAEGIIYSVEYQMPGGQPEGFTRVNDNRCVPGGNGSWNEDEYGRLTHDFLIITNRKHPELGPEYIPVSRLLRVRFGDGGIEQVDRQTKPGK